MLKINRSELVAVAVKPVQYPAENMAEIAFAGRSNAGKSTALNALTNQKNLAFKSSNRQKKAGKGFRCAGKDQNYKFL